MKKKCVQKSKNSEVGKNKEKNSSQPQPHDLFFKRFFSTVRRILELLKIALPKRILDLFDLKTLQIEKDVFVKDLEMRVDLVLRVMFKGSQRPAKIILIVDHKSFLDREVFNKLLKYQAVAYTKYGDPVFTLIFYHGQKRWTLPKNFHEHLLSRGHLPKKALEELGDYLINFTPYIFDLSGFDAKNKGHENIKPILYVFQQIWSLDKNKSSKEGYEFLQKFFSLTKKLSKSHKEGYIIDMMADVLTYFHQYNPKLNKRTLKMASQEITKKLGGIDLMEAYDFTIKGAIKRGQQEGMQKGVQQGMQQGMQKGVQQGMQQGMQKGVQQGMQQGMQKGVQQGMQQGIQKGVQQGIQQGMQQLQEVALKLLEMGMNIDKVSQVTGLSKLKIRKLQVKVEK